MTTQQMILNRQEARDLDRRAMEEYGIAGVVLMESAGRGAAEYLLSQHVEGPVIICCGKGNNGGDGFVIARYLHNQAVQVRVLVFSQPKDFSHDAKINYDIIAKMGIPIIYCYGKESYEDELLSAKWVVDALFGTGLEGMVKAPYDAIVQSMNATPAKILAIDIPSGLDCDTGKPLGVAIKAQYTVTFVALKKGFINREAKEYLGQVHVIDIGIPKD